MKMFPTKFEIYEDENLIAVFSGFDSECLQVEIDSRVLTPEELDEISGFFALAYEQYKNGVTA